MIKTHLNKLLKLPFGSINLYSCHLQPRMDARPDSIPTLLKDLAKKSKVLEGEL